MGGLVSGKFLFLLFVALIVLGPDKLPEAARTAGRLLHEFRRVTGGLQEEVRDAFAASDLAAPVQELKAVRDGFRSAATGLVSAPFAATSAPTAGPSPMAEPDQSAIAPGSPGTTAWSSDPPTDPGRLPTSLRTGDLGLPPGDPGLN